jgi:hypothetical protein
MHMSPLKCNPPYLITSLLVLVYKFGIQKHHLSRTISPPHLLVKKSETFYATVAR